MHYFFTALFMKYFYLYITFFRKSTLNKFYTKVAKSILNDVKNALS